MGQRTKQTFLHSVDYYFILLVSKRVIFLLYKDLSSVKCYCINKNVQSHSILYTHSELYAKYQTISLKNYPSLGHKTRRLGAQLFSVFWGKIFTKIIRVRYGASHRDSQVTLEVKNPCANVEDVRGVGQIPGWGRHFGGGHGNLLQYFCLECPMNRGSWWAIVHRVPKSQSRLKRPGYMHQVSLTVTVK